MNGQRFSNAPYGTHDLSNLTGRRFTLTTARTADRLLLLDPAQLALGNVPTLPADGAEDPAVRHAFTETPQERFLGFIWFQSHMCHILPFTPFR